MLAAVLTALCCGLAVAIDGSRVLVEGDPAEALQRIEARLADDPPQDPMERAALLEARGTLYRNAGRLDEAERDARQIQEILGDSGPPQYRSDAAFMLGTVLAERGALADALASFQTALGLLAEGDQFGRKIRALNAIAVTHNFLHDYPRAREYLEQALRLAREHGDHDNEATVLGNLGLAVAEIEGVEAGLAIHRQALALAREHGRDVLATEQLANLCSRQTQAGMFERALSDCRDALALARQLGMRRLEAGTRMTLGVLASRQGQLEQAEAELEAALALAEDQVPSVEIPALQTLAEVLERLDRPADANATLRRLIERRQQLLEKQHAERVAELEASYASAEQQREIELLQLEAELRESQLQRRSLLLYGSLAAIALLAVSTFIIGRSLLQRKRLGARIIEHNSRLQDALSTISHLARHDELTGLYNRRAFVELAHQAISRNARDPSSLVLAMADVDDFKSINDRLGHAVGDEVLKGVAQRLREQLRSIDLLCRWGGEEFVLLLQGNDASGGMAVLERVAAAVAQRPIDTDSGPFPITMTIGMATIEESLDAALKAADQAMYRGKQAGRNRIVVAGPTPDCD